MCQKKKNSPSDSEIIESALNDMERLHEDETTFLLIGYTEGRKHFAVMGSGGMLAELIRGTFAFPEDETVEVLGTIITTALFGAMLDNDELFGLADHLLEKTGDLRVEKVRKKAKEEFAS